MISGGKQKQMAIVRICLGTAQTTAATMALFFLIQTGASTFTIVASLGCVGLVTLSRFIFRNEE